MNGVVGEKTIFYTDCVGVQFSPKSGLASGYIEIETATGMGKHGQGVLASENAFIWRGEQTNEKMEKVANYIRERVQSCKQARNTPIIASTSADEIKKYKELLDMGIITQEEFDAKKKQLLGL